MRESDVYIQTEAPLAEVAELAGSKLGLVFRPEDIDGERFFVAVDGDRRVTLCANEFVEPEFEEIAGFQASLTVDGSDDAERLRYARRMFERLSRLRRFPLLLVDELSIVDRYEPA